MASSIMAYSQSAPFSKHIVQSSKVPKAIGPYSQAIISGDLIYLSGQIAINPENGILVQDSFKAEVRQVMENIKNIIETAGSNIDNVIKSTVYLTDIANFSEFNTIYAEYFKEPYPARETIQVVALPKNARIEISVICHR